MQRKWMKIQQKIGYSAFFAFTFLIQQVSSSWDQLSDYLGKCSPSQLFESSPWCSTSIVTCSFPSFYYAFFKLGKQNYFFVVHHLFTAIPKVCELLFAIHHFSRHLFSPGLMEWSCLQSTVLFNNVCKTVLIIRLQYLRLQKFLGNELSDANSRVWSFRC